MVTERLKISLTSMEIISQLVKGRKDLWFSILTYTLSRRSTSNIQVSTKGIVIIFVEVPTKFLHKTISLIES